MQTRSTSTCVAACAKAWPAATISGTPAAGTGITGTVTTSTRDDGTVRRLGGGRDRQVNPAAT